MKLSPINKAEMNLKSKSFRSCVLTSSSFILLAIFISVFLIDAFSKFAQIKSISTKLIQGNTTEGDPFECYHPIYTFVIKACYAGSLVLKSYPNIMIFFFFSLFLSTILNYLSQRYQEPSLVRI